MPVVAFWLVELFTSELEVLAFGRSSRRLGLTHF